MLLRRTGEFWVVHISISPVEVNADYVGFMKSNAQLKKYLEGMFDVW